MSRMVRKISHICLLVHDADASAAHWRETFGFVQVNDLTFAGEGVRSVFLAANGTPDEIAVEFMELIDKADPDHPLAQRLAKTGEGFYLVCMQVEDAAASAAALTEKGLRVSMRPALGAGMGGRWLLHPKDATGVMIEAIEDDVLKVAKVD